MPRHRRALVALAAGGPTGAAAVITGLAAGDLPGAVIACLGATLLFTVIAWAILARPESDDE